MPLQSWAEPLGPGRHHIEVAEAEETRSQSKGDLMWKVKLRAVGGMNSIRDVIMLEGPGLDMGIAKLSRLGVTKDMLGIPASRIVGRRAYINIVNEKYDDPRTGEPKERTKVGSMYEVDPEQPPMTKEPVADPNLTPF